jgi:hypothetical protein
VNSLSTPAKSTTRPRSAPVAGADAGAHTAGVPIEGVAKQTPTRPGNATLWLSQDLSKKFIGALPSAPCERELVQLNSCLSVVARKLHSENMRRNRELARAALKAARKTSPPVLPASVAMQLSESNPDAKDYSFAKQAVEKPREPVPARSPAKVSFAAAKPRTDASEPFDQSGAAPTTEEVTKAMWRGLRGVADARKKTCSKLRFLRWATTDGKWGLKAVEPLATLSWNKALETATELDVPNLVDESGRVTVLAAKEMTDSDFAQMRRVAREMGLAERRSNHEVRIPTKRPREESARKNHAHRASVKRRSVENVKKLAAVIGPLISDLAQIMTKINKAFMENDLSSSVTSDTLSE